MYVGHRIVGDIKVNSGMRQGCAGSPLLFVLLINQIIKKINESRMGFTNSKFYIPVLFYADDGLILSNSRKEMEQMVTLVTETSAKCGLNINGQKS